MWIGPFLHAMYGAALFVMCQIKLLLLFSCLYGNARVALRERERERERERGKVREKHRGENKSSNPAKRNRHGQPSVKIPNWLFDFISAVFALPQPHVCLKLWACVFTWDKQWETWKSTPHSPINECSSYSVTTPCCDQLSCWTVLRSLLMFKWPRTWNISIDPGSSDLCLSR